MLGWVGGGGSLVAWGLLQVMMVDEWHVTEMVVFRMVVFRGVSMESRQWHILGAYKEIPIRNQYAPNGYAWAAQQACCLMSHYTHSLSRCMYTNKPFSDIFVFNHETNCRGK